MIQPAVQKQCTLFVLAFLAVAVVLAFAEWKSLILFAVGLAAAVVSITAAFFVLSRRGVLRWLALAVFAAAPVTVLVVYAFANLLWAPVYVIELALLEEHYARLRGTILQWWAAWVCSYLVSIAAIATSFATDAQGVANNTVLMVVAYLFAAVTLAAAARVFVGFQRKPVARPAHRWVAVPDDRPAAPARSSSRRDTMPTVRCAI